MRYLIITMIILVMLGAVGIVVLKNSGSGHPHGHALRPPGQLFCTEVTFRPTPGLGYFINFDRYPGWPGTRPLCISECAVFQLYRVRKQTSPRTLYSRPHC